MMEEKSCHVEPLQKQPGAEELSQTARKWLAVKGLGCPNCSNRVRNSLLRLEGISEAEVDHIRGVAIVDFNPSMVRLIDMDRAVSAAGGDGRHEYSVVTVA
jgi:Cu+-exporting ATPase